MRDDVDGAAAFDAWRQVGILDVYRNMHADQRAFGQPHEIDMQRDIFHRLQLVVARNHAVFLAIDVNVIERGEEAPGINLGAKLDVIE
jgi:hypothetical protein